jgi:ATP:ADP antiporter, AAA family
VCPECWAVVGPHAPTLKPPAEQARHSPEPGRGVLNGLILIARSPYLLTMAAYMLMFTITSSFLWFEQARIVKANFTVASERISYLATIDLLVNVIALCTQMFITGRLLTRLGVIAGLLLLPIVTLGGFAWLANSQVPLTLLIVQVSRRGLHYAVDRPTREVLYTVLGPEEKYKSKSFIDTFVYRGGDLAGAWTDLWLNKAGLMVAAVGMGVAVVWMGAGTALATMQRRKVRAAEAPVDQAAPPAAAQAGR